MTKYAIKPKPLADLPNLDGFRFTGTLKESGCFVACIVLKNTEGVHDAYHAVHLTPIFNQLAGWHFINE